MKTNNETEWLDDLSLTSIFKKRGKWFFDDEKSVSMICRVQV